MKSPRILLVDIDPEARAGLAQWISRIDGIELAGVAADVQEAAVLIARQRPDVILVDLHLQEDEDGRVCSALRGVTNAPVVALVSFMTPDRWRTIEAAGAQAYMLKHLDSRQFGRELRAFAKGHAQHGKERSS
jgi:DNA-binding NarL/FixJ family response regulator